MAARFVDTIFGELVTFWVRIHITGDKTALRKRQ